MDRRSWLWRRKLSDKSSGDTVSLGSGSGSLSSPSERFSDEQQVYSIQNAQFPAVTLKHAEDTNDSVKILCEKLSAAFGSISEKEELVKQHAKVAEEAVIGWERAENEIDALKQQLDNAMTKNSILEDKIVHLDEALKECSRQLTQLREEQAQRVKEAVGKKSDDTGSKSSAELEYAKAEAALSLEADLRLKLASFEKENTSLQLELRLQLEALEVRTLERDLNAKRAETASKHHLESVKRVASLEAECRRLKAMACKETSLNDHKSLELDPFKVDPTSLKTDMASPSSIRFMDDFLEMEKLVALPVRENRTSVERCNESGNDRTLVKDERETMINRTAELKEKIEMVKAEKVELGLIVTQCQDQLELSESSFRQLQAQFSQCQNQLKLSRVQLKDANKKLGISQAELDLARELRQAIDLELDDANVRREEAEARNKAIEDESKILMSKVTLLECKAEKERAIYLKASEKCRVLEYELFRMKIEVSRAKGEADRWQSQLTSVNDLKEAITRELKMTNANKEEVGVQLEAAQGEAKSLLVKVSSLENELQQERILSVAFAAKCKELRDELSRMKSEVDTQFVPPPLSKEEFNRQQEKELAVAASKLSQCQKTIASLADQLKSLWSIEDLFPGSDSQLNLYDKETQLLGNDREPQPPTTLQSSSIIALKSDLLSLV